MHTCTRRNLRLSPSVLPPPRGRLLPPRIYMYIYVTNSSRILDTQSHNSYYNNNCKGRGHLLMHGSCAPERAICLPAETYRNPRGRIQLSERTTRTFGKFERFSEFRPLFLTRRHSGGVYLPILHEIEVCMLASRIKSSAFHSR